jgi:hypothetical protein
MFVAYCRASVCVCVSVCVVAAVCEPCVFVCVCGSAVIHLNIRSALRAGDEMEALLVLRGGPDLAEELDPNFPMGAAEVRQ